MYHTSSYLDVITYSYYSLRQLNFCPNLIVHNDEMLYEMFRWLLQLQGVNAYYPDMHQKQLLRKKVDFLLEPNTRGHDFGRVPHARYKYKNKTLLRHVLILGGRTGLTLRCAHHQVIEEIISLCPVMTLVSLPLKPEHSSAFKLKLYNYWQCSGTTKSTLQKNHTLSFKNK